MRLKLKQLLSIGLSTACIMASANLALANPTPPPEKMEVSANKSLKEPPKLDQNKWSGSKYNYSNQGFELKCGYQHSDWAEAITEVSLKSADGTWTKVEKQNNVYYEEGKDVSFYVLQSSDGGICLCRYKEPAVKLTVRIKATGYKTKEITLEKGKGTHFAKFQMKETTVEDEAPQPKEVKVTFKYKDNDSKTILIKENQKLTKQQIPNEYQDEKIVDYWYMEGNENTPYEFDTPVKRDLTLVAKRKEYQVNFYKWNGDDISSPRKVKAGDKVEKPNIANVLTWYTTQNFSENSKYDFNTPVIETLNLYAKQVYKVKLMYKDKSEVVEIESTANGASLKKEHYENYENVEYWYPENEPDTKYTPNNLQFVLIYEDTTFIAKIKEAPTEYTVTFQYGNDSKTISVKHNEKVSAPDISDWKDSDGDRLEIKGWKNGSEVFTLDTPITGNLTLTAEQQDKFTVTFKVEGMDNTVVKVYKDKTVSAPQLNVEIEKWHLENHDDKFDFENTKITGDITIIGDKKEAAPPNDNGGQQPPNNGGDPQPPNNGGDPQPPNNGGDPQPPNNGGDPQPPNNGGDPQPPNNGGDSNPNPFIPPLPLDFDSLNIPETTIDDNATPLSTSDDHSTEPVEDEDVILSDDETDSEDEILTDKEDIVDEDLPLAGIKKEDELEITGENIPLSNIPKTSEQSISIFYLSLTLMGGLFFSIFELLRKKINK